MPDRSRKRPRDPNQLAKFVVDVATGGREDVDIAAEERQKNPAAVELGRLGGQKGGRSRANKLSPAQRSEIAKAAAAARWSNKKDQE
jgi:hypothetical protein